MKWLLRPSICVLQGTHTQKKNLQCLSNCVNYQMGNTSVFILKLLMSYLDIRVASLLFLSMFFLSFCQPSLQGVLLLQRRQARELLNPVGLLFLRFFHGEGVSKGTLGVKKIHYLLLLWKELWMLCLIVPSGLKPSEEANFFWVVLVFGLPVYILYYHNACLVYNSFQWSIFSTFMFEKGPSNQNYWRDYHNRTWRTKSQFLI